MQLGEHAARALFGRAHRYAAHAQRRRGCVGDQSDEHWTAVWRRAQRFGERRVARALRDDFARASMQRQSESERSLDDAQREHRIALQRVGIAERQRPFEALDPFGDALGTHPAFA